MSDVFQLDDVVLVRRTGKAMLVRMCSIKPSEAKTGINQLWIPDSVVIDSDLEEEGDSGCIEIQGWFAKKEEIDEAF